MEQSRSYVPTNFGVAGDDLYLASSSTKITECRYYTDDEGQVLRDMYSSGMASRATKVSGMPQGLFGREYFSSTNRGRPLMNNCSHWRLAATNLPFAIAYPNYRDSRSKYERKYWRESFPYITPPSWASLLSYWSQNQNAYGFARERAWHTMQPRFEGEVSMLNFLFELKDFKQLSAFVLKKRRQIFLEDKLTRVVSSLRKEGATRTAAEMHLLYQFGIAPFMKDFAVILAQLLVIVQDAQQKFLLDGENIQKRHYAENLQYQDSASSTLADFWLSSGELRTVDFNATLHYTYGYMPRNPVEAVLKYWGLSGSFEALWNALPFSFLADYFLAIGRSIRAMEHDQNVKLRWFEYAESLKVSIMTGKRFNGHPGVCGTVIDGVYNRAGNAGDVLLSGYQASVYSRRVMDPHRGPALPKAKGPSARQSANIVALLRCLM